MSKKKDILKELEGENQVADVVEETTTDPDIPVVAPEEEAVTEDEIDSEPEKDIPKGPESFTGTVSCNLLNVRALPDKTSRIVTILSRGTELTGLTETEDPAWLAYTGFGYVMAEFIKRK